MNRFHRSILGAITIVACAGVVSIVSASSHADAPAPAGPPRLNASHSCSFCHLTHNAPGPSLLVNTSVQVMCLTCHGPGGVSVLKAANHQGQTCTVCHNPHDGEINRLGNRNLKMMKADVVARDSTTHRPVTFESRGTDVGQPALHSFCDADGDHDQIYDNVCDTCHRNSPDIHRYTAANSHSHNTGRTCTNCHLHRRGFNAD